MISYIGGKSKIAPQLIIPNIPNDIETYVEPFSGMFWTFFKMDLSKFNKLNKIVYNDFNPLNVNLFNCVKNYNIFYDVIKIMSLKIKNYLIFHKKRYLIKI